MGCSKSDLSGCRDPLPPLPLLTKEGSENRQKSPTRFGEEPEILLDGGMLNRFHIGPIHRGTIKRGTLRASSPIIAGVHQIRIRITRPFASMAAPFQYLDNVVVFQKPDSSQ